MNKLLHPARNLIGTAYNLMRHCFQKGIMKAINDPSSDMVAYGMSNPLGREQIEANVQVHGMRLVSDVKRVERNQLL